MLTKALDCLLACLRVRACARASSYSGVEAFSIFQDISLSNEACEPRVDNVVVFGDGIGELRVEADAITDARPLEGFVPRKGQGLPFLGKSDNSPPSAPNKRIDFQFSRAAFDLKALPFKIPYPVPFKLLRDESKGWLDTTYLSPDGTLRISRGNKGTTFVLIKEPTASERLVTALAARPADVPAAVEDLIGVPLASVVGDASPDALAGMGEIRRLGALLEGTWKLRWSSQGQGANPLQKLASAFESYQVVDGDGRGGVESLQNVAKFAPFLVQRADAVCCAPEDAGPNRLGVEIGGATLTAGPWDISLNLAGQGWLQVLYVDDQVRISRGSKGSVFIHSRHPDGV